MAATVRELWPGANARPASVTVAGAVQQYLASPACPEPAGPERRVRAATLHRLAEQLGPGRALGEVTEGELATSLRHLGATAGAGNQHRATVRTWLTWCARQPKWTAPLLPTTVRRAPDKHTAHPHHERYRRTAGWLR